MGLTQLCWLSDLMSDTREKDFPNAEITYGINRHENNIYGTNYIWYETGMKCTNYTYGTKLIKPMVRNGKCMVQNCKIWYEMHMVRNGYGTKRLDTT